MSKYNAYTDHELTQLMSEGDRVAFGEIYNRYKGILFVHAYRRLNNQEEAEDVIHDLFTTIWNKRAEITISTQLSAYFYTAVKNRVFKKISRKKIESDYISSINKTIEEGQFITDHKVRESELTKIIEREVAALPPKMREIFLLSRYENLSHKEIAAKLSLSEQTVSKQITNALKILRVKLGLILFLIYLIKY